MPRRLDAQQRGQKGYPCWHDMPEADLRRQKILADAVMRPSQPVRRRRLTAANLCHSSDGPGAKSDVAMNERRTRGRQPLLEALGRGGRADAADAVELK